MPTVQTNGISIYYEVHGQGQPLVLISGLGYGLWQWQRMIPGLAEHFRVIAFDNRGAGQSDKPDGPYSAAMLAADTAGLIDALEAAPAIVMGHSMGGFVAQQLALTYPDKVSKLILASTNFGGPHHIPITPQAMAVIMNREGDPITLIRNGIEIACAPGFAEAHPELVQALIDYRLTNPCPRPVPGPDRDRAGPVRRGGRLRGQAERGRGPNPDPVWGARRGRPAGQCHPASPRTARLPDRDPARRGPHVPDRNPRRRRESNRRLRGLAPSHDASVSPSPRCGEGAGGCGCATDALPARKT